MEKLFRNIASGLFFLLLVNQCIAKNENVRTILNFGNGWKFQLGDVTRAEIPDFNDSSWRKLNVPHDWSIEGEFKEENPATPEGGALPGGIGWYRKSFKISADDLKHSVFIDFDGVYQNSEVWINGHSVAKRFYGYSSFQYELTPYLTSGQKGNVLAVKVGNSLQPNSRFYSGSGIFRNVWLIKTGNTHIDHWGTSITTPEIANLAAKVKVVIRIKSQLKSDQKLVLKTVILDPEGNEVATGKVATNSIKDSVSSATFDFTVKNPALWNLEAPKLYSAVSHVFVDGELVDNSTTPFGIRNFEFTVDKGFFLNGKNGKEVLVREVKTAGIPARLLIKPNRSEIKADGNDLSFVTVDVVDKNGVIIPDADNLVKFKLEGAGTIVGVDNGNPVSHESFKARQRQAFHGKCLVVIQSGEKSGIVKLTAGSEDMPAATVEIRPK